jgi:hypothetical protein
MSENANISKNKAAELGGGVYLSEGDFSMYIGSPRIENNTAGNEGGGVFITGKDSKFTMSGGIIDGNSAETNGGGIYLNDGEFGMFNVNPYTFTISNNSAMNGGGIYLNSGTANISGSSVTLNEASNADVADNQGGGGIFINIGESLTLNGSAPTATGGNTAGGVSSPYYPSYSW